MIALVSLPGPQGAAAAVVVAAVGASRMARLALWQIGGQTGDVLGAPSRSWRRRCW